MIRPERPNGAILVGSRTERPLPRRTVSVAAVGGRKPASVEGRRPQPRQPPSVIGSSGSWHAASSPTGDSLTPMRRQSSSARCSGAPGSGDRREITVAPIRIRRRRPGGA